jgi:hypothetical protein
LVVNTKDTCKLLLTHNTIYSWGRRGRDRIVVGFISTYIQSMPITTDVVSSNLDQGEVYNM